MHDELLFEVDETEMSEVIKIIQNRMEHAHESELNVTMKVALSVGYSWGSLLKVSDQLDLE